VVDIEPYLQLKIDALAQHRSQISYAAAITRMSSVRGQFCTSLGIRPIYYLIE
jgi:hypothetical protein